MRKKVQRGWASRPLRPQVGSHSKKKIYNKDLYDEKEEGKEGVRQSIQWGTTVETSHDPGRPDLTPKIRREERKEIFKICGSGKILTYWAHRFHDPRGT